ncbi:MAG TPA: polysaccharide deacetylase family protein [Gaiellaceae bacterium]|nr:polysaccharide deacetylase family protein [Gaiellaceae bacterium]
MTWFLPAPAAHLPALAARLRIDRRLDRPVVALTFDDGPHPQGTPAVLEELARFGARATFFLVGEQVRAHPDVARAVADAGHEIGVHCDRHTLLLRRPPPAVELDLARALESIRAATGADPVLHRAPYGVYSSGALRIVRRLGLRPLLWSRWGRDWERRASAASIARRAAAGLRTGDVVLLHDSDAYGARGSWRKTAYAVPSLLEAIATLGVPADSVTHST